MISETGTHAATEKYSKLAGHAVKAYHGRSIVNDAEVDLVAVSVKVPEPYKVIMPAIEAGKTSSSSGPLVSRMKRL